MQRRLGHGCFFSVSARIMPLICWRTVLRTAERDGMQNDPQRCTHSASLHLFTWSLPLPPQPPSAHACPGPPRPRKHARILARHPQAPRRAPSPGRRSCHLAEHHAGPPYSYPMADELHVQRRMRSMAQPRPPPRLSTDTDVPSLVALTAHEIARARMQLQFCLPSSIEH